MSSNAVFFRWNRSAAGRERLSEATFEVFADYRAGLEKCGKTGSFALALLNPHGAT